jgi:hypothetical protein
LAHLKATANRAERWPEGALEKKVSVLLVDDGAVWRYLGLSDEDLVELTITDEGAARLRGELWPEAVQALVASCARGHSRDIAGRA